MLTCTYTYTHARTHTHTHTHTHKHKHKHKHKHTQDDALGAEEDEVVIPPHALVSCSTIARNLSRECSAASGDATDPASIKFRELPSGYIHTYTSMSDGASAAGEAAEATRLAMDANEAAVARIVRVLARKRLGLRRAFETLDVRGDGALTPEELAQVVLRVRGFVRARTRTHARMHAHTHTLTRTGPGALGDGARGR